MRSPTMLGLSVGALAVAIGAGGTLRRGDPHYVSGAPDLVSLVVIWLAMYAALRALPAPGATRAREAARRLIAAACAVDGVGMAAFTVWYLPPHPVSLAVFAALSSAALLALLGWSSARVAIRPAAAAPPA